MIQLKTKEEIAILREAGLRHKKILDLLAEQVTPGTRSDDLDREAARLIADSEGSAAFLGYRPEGAPRSYPASVCVSVNDEIVHGIPNEDPKIFKENDLVSVDIGFKYRGLITDAAVTVCVGSCSPERRKLTEATKTALFEGIQAIRPGGTVGDIGSAIFEYVRSTPFSLVKHLSGHGVGHAVHEDPFVPNVGRAGHGPELVPGMVLAIEPMLTPGSGEIRLLSDGYTYVTKGGEPAAHWEHTVVITDHGVEILTG